MKKMIKGSANLIIGPTTGSKEAMSSLGTMKGTRALGNNNAIAASIPIGSNANWMKKAGTLGLHHKIEIGKNIQNRMKVNIETNAIPLL